MKQLMLVLLLATLPRIDDIVAKYAKKDEPGCAFGVAANGEVITRAFGLANLEYDIPLTPDSIFESGSVSKQFTAAAVVQLARDDRTRGDDESVPPPKKESFDPKYAGLYRNPKTDALLRFFVNKDGELRIGFGGNGQAINPDAVHFLDGDRVRLTTTDGYDATYQRVAEWKPAPADLQKLAGRYRSDEIWTTYELRFRDGKLYLHLDPDPNDDELVPTFANAFRDGNSILITKNGDGFDVKSDFSMSSGVARLERLHFTRVK